MLPEIKLIDFYHILPMIILIGLSGLSLILEISFKEKGRVFNGLVCILGTWAALYVTMVLFLDATQAKFLPFAGSLVFDTYALFFSMIFLVATFFALILESGHEDVRCGEVYSLTLLCAVGMMLMATGLDLFTILLGLEVMSLSVYALAGTKRTDLFSNESSLKYFVLGAFSSAFFLYGMALIYASTNSIYLQAISSAINAGNHTPLLTFTGMVLVLVGFGFKVALVPFHMWTPDVYEGAPTSITTLMATGVKAGGFAGFLRVFLLAFGSFQMEWSQILWVLAVLTMTLGNVVALTQKSIKRMLSYSSIAHAGYMLLALIAARQGNEEIATSGLLYYLWAYVFTTAGAFAVVFYLEENQEEADPLRYRGLGWRKPFLGICMSIFLLSLGGIPPTAGFLGKFYVFSSALRAGYFWLVIIAVINSLISLYYYLKPVVWMYMLEADPISDGIPRQGKKWVGEMVFLILLITSLGTLYFGLFPSTFSSLAKEAAESILPLTSLAVIP